MAPKDDPNMLKYVFITEESDRQEKRKEPGKGFE